MEYKKVFYQAWGESRGLGKKASEAGSSLHLSEQDISTFSNDFTSNNHGFIVCFETIGDSQQVQVSTDLYERIEKTKNGLKLGQSETNQAIQNRHLLLGLERKLA